MVCELGLLVVQGVDVVDDFTGDTDVEHEVDEELYDLLGVLDVEHGVDDADKLGVLDVEYGVDDDELGVLDVDDELDDVELAEGQFVQRYASSQYG